MRPVSSEESSNPLHVAFSLQEDYERAPSAAKVPQLEAAIQICEAVVRVMPQEAAPGLWAGIHNNLGNAYCNLPRGDRGENLERAIACYQDALRVRTERDFPRTGP